jgi:hypothetical protein
MLKHQLRSRRRLEKQLPLRVTEVFADPHEFRIVGKRSHVSVRGPWRVSEGDRVLFGWSTPQVQSLANSLCGVAVTHLDFEDSERWHGFIRGSHFSNGMRLDVWLDVPGGQSWATPGWR